MKTGEWGGELNSVQLHLFVQLQSTKYFIEGHFTWWSKVKTQYYREDPTNFSLSKHNKRSGGGNKVKNES